MRNNIIITTDPESMSPLKSPHSENYRFIELIEQTNRQANMRAAREKLKVHKIFVSASPEHVFDNLYDQIDFSLLQLAEKDVRSQSTWGLDSALATEYGHKAYVDLPLLTDEIATDTYARRKAIPFSKNGREVTKIAIRDKVLQKAVSLLLDPIFRPLFQGVCVSSGIGRDKIAVRVKEILRRKKTRFVFRADISKFFPSVDKGKMMAFLRKRVSDERLLNLIQLWLDMDLIGPNGTFYKSYENGILQGSPIAQLLADIYLNFVVDDWVRANRKEVTTMLRYVDDMLFAFSSYRAYEKFRSDLEARLSEFNLKLSGDLKKTRVISLDNCAIGTKSFRFLGYSHFIFVPNTPVQPYQRSIRRIVSRPSLQSVAKYRDRFSKILARQHYPKVRRDNDSFLPFAENKQLVENIGAVLRGFIKAYRTSYGTLKTDSKKIIQRTVKWAVNSWFEEYGMRMALRDHEAYTDVEIDYLLHKNDQLCQRVHFNYVLTKYGFGDILAYYSNGPRKSMRRYVQYLKLIIKRGGEPESAYGATLLMRLQSHVLDWPG